MHTTPRGYAHECWHKPEQLPVATSETTVVKKVILDASYLVKYLTNFRPSEKMSEQN